MKYWTSRIFTGKDSVLVLLPDLPNVENVYTFDFKGQTYHFSRLAASGWDWYPEGAIPARIAYRQPIS